MKITDRVRSIGQGYLKIDEAAHKWLLLRYPELISTVDSLLVKIVDKFISSPVFAIVLSLVLLVLGVAGVARIVLIAILAAWAISFL